MEEYGEAHVPKSMDENVDNFAAGDVSSQSMGPGNYSQPSDGQEPRSTRLLVFNKVMDKSLDMFMAGASFHRFAHMFHPLYKKNPQVTEIIHREFIEDLQRTIKEDIDKVIEEGHLQCSLDELDKLEKKAESSDPAWRPSGVPEQDLASFVMPYYKKQGAYLRQQLKKIQQENAGLAQRVQAGRDGIVQTEQRIISAVDEWKASASQFQTIASSSCPPDTFNI